MSQRKSINAKSGTLSAIGGALPVFAMYWSTEMDYQISQLFYGADRAVHWDQIFKYCVTSGFFTGLIGGYQRDQPSAKEEALDSLQPPSASAEKIVYVERPEPVSESTSRPTFVDDMDFDDDPAFHPKKNEIIVPDIGLYSQMTISQNGVDLIRKFEGLRLTSYQCSADVWTIGYGHTSRAGSPKVYEGMAITTQQAEQILKKDLFQYEKAVNDSITDEILQHQFDALVSLAYNIGGGALAKSTAIRKFNLGDIEGAADAILMWNKSGGKIMKGLVRRREAERDLFLGEVDEMTAIVDNESA